jgi:hypothetical protein
MPFIPPASGEISIYLHFEDATSCKDWALKFTPVSASTWSLENAWGPASRLAPGTKPAMKAKLAQSRTHFAAGEDYNKVAEDFVRRVKAQLKQGYSLVDAKLPADLDTAITLAGVTSASGKTRPAAKNELLDKLETLLDPKRPDKIPVLLDGPPGTGKTYTCREFAKVGGFHACAEVAGNSSMESIDFLGGMVPIGGGKMIWMDGPVTRAFREAARGRKMLLLIDELYRIPRRERGIFLNALIPHDGTYRLRTGRAVGIDEKEGIASMELLGAPVENLSIVATTNSGSNFPDVEDEDPAGRERWHILHVEAKELMLKSILTSRITARGWPTSLTADFLALQKAVQLVYADNFCQKELSPRLVLRVFDLTAEPKREAIKTAAQELIPALTGRMPDGALIQEQVDSLNTAIASALKP